MSIRASFVRACLVTAGIACAAPASRPSTPSVPFLDLQTRIDAALPGDIIIVRRGVYTASASITVGRQGTCDSPRRPSALPGANTSSQRLNFG